MRRIWDRDPSVWSNADEDRWLGWLTLPMQEREGVARPLTFANEIKAEGITDVVLLGMGGSSLAPEVMRSIIGRTERLSVSSRRRLDGSWTDPLSGARDRLSADDLPRGVQVGDDARGEHPQAAFFSPGRQELGEAEAGRRFVLTTDPGSKLEQVAQQEGFRAIFPGMPTVGGRYSALSNFGLVPAALLGADPVCCSTVRATWRSAVRRPDPRIRRSSSVWCSASWRLPGATSRR